MSDLKFEDCLARLEQIVAALEAGNLPLEDSLKVFEEGVSLARLLDNPAAEWSRPAFTQVQRGGFPGHSVRTERWRYTEWDGGAKGAQLYDHAVDPRELTNVASDPKHAAALAELRALVKKNWPVRVSGGVPPAAEKR